MFRSKFLLLWIVLLLLSSGWTFFRLTNGVVLETNIFDALPRSEENADIVDVARKVSETQSKMLLYLVQSKKLPELIAATKSLRTRINSTGLFEYAKSGMDSGQLSDVFKTYHNYPGLRLDPIYKTEESTLQHVKTLIYSPGGLPVGSLLAQDPLMTSVANLKSLSMSLSNFKNSDGISYIESKNTFFGFIEAKLLQSPFSRSAQQDISFKLNEAERSFAEDFPDMTLLQGGALKFAEHAAATSESDIKRISAGSSLAVITLLLICFRSIKLAFVAVLPIVAGILVASTVLCSLYSSIHIISFAFGASLIGIAVDYCIHYFLMPHVSTLRSIERGLLTTCVGFGALLMAPFAGIKQMAVFSIVGLVTAYLCIRSVYSSDWLERLRKPNLPLYIKGYLDKVIGKTQVLNVICVIVLSLGLAVWLPRFVDDDVRLLQQAPEALVNEENQVRELLDMVNTEQFLLVKDTSEESLLSKLKSLEPSLKLAQANKAYDSYISLTSYYEPPNFQIENIETFKKLLEEGSSISSFFKSIGLSEEPLTKFKEKLNKAPILSFDSFVNSAMGERLQHLWLGKLNEKEYGALILFKNLADTKELQAITNKIDGVHFISSVDEISKLFRTYRRHIGYLLSIAVVVILLILGSNFGLFKAIRMLQVPVISGTLACLICALIGLPLNIFVLLALILVAGIGIDYTIFLNSEENYSLAYLGNILSAMTSIFAFGFLALSEMPALFAFGFTLSVGIVVSVLLAPLTLSSDTHLQ